MPETIAHGDGEVDPAAALAAALEGDGSAGDDGGDGGAAAPAASDSPADGGAPATAADEPRMVPWEEFVALRRENASYRKRFQPFEQVFGNLDDEIREGLLELGRLYSEDPEQAARRLLEVFVGEIDGEPGDQGEQPQYLTREQFREELANFYAEQRKAEEEQRALESSRAEIQAKAKEFGIEPGTKQYRQLLAIARAEFATDEFGAPRPPVEAVELAAKSMIDELSEFEKRVIARFLEGKGQPGVTPVGAGEPGSPEKVPASLEEAAAAFRAAIGA